MNIFFLDLNVILCALYHCDKHVVKMILETTQLLCSVHHMIESEYKPPYKLTHKNHPCAIWTRSSLANYMWLVSLGKALCEEYTYRYKKIHKCQAYIEALGDNKPLIADIGFTVPAQAMPDSYKDENVVIAYRTYYYLDKKHLHSWKNRDVPQWVQDIRNGM